MMRQPWKPPTKIDLVKELNAHAQRRGTIFALIVAATTFSVGNSGAEFLGGAGQDDSFQRAST